MDNEMQFLLYRSAEEDVSVNAVIKDETIWLTQKAMAELFGVEVPTISKHLSNIYEEGELVRERTVSKMESVQTEGSRNVRRQVDYYNLDAIISVGYRVNSRRATRFRIWATGILKEYMTKGFVLDDDRLKQGQTVPLLVRQQLKLYIHMPIKPKSTWDLQRGRMRQTAEFPQRKLRQRQKRNI